MHIKTQNMRPPVPLRNYDWSAIDEDTYEHGQPIGWGETEQEAIEDLLEQIALAR